MNDIAKLIEFTRNEEKYDVVLNKSTAELCSFKIGGECKAAIYPKSTSALVELVRYLYRYRYKYKFTILGNGTNVVFCDSLYKGIVVCTSRVNNIEISDCKIEAGCGCMLGTICNKAQGAALSGIEFAYGIPGTLGGGIFMNAGAYDGELADIIKCVSAYDVENDRVDVFTKEECRFGYRDSVFQHSSYVILKAQLTLTHGDSAEIKEKMDDFMKRRRDKQPLELPSAGSAFKRYPGRYTAAMIDEAGLKGRCVGGAGVSTRHAGFIVNNGGATCRDVKELTEIIKTEIRKRDGIDIECEIRFIE